ncbi:hypothetical protein OVA29_18145 [Exiguobacterium sp. SL14]|nr:hypothetical protein [Exiguobacterium sp. SL14]MCY1692257.1 hypothetical protein [Exiguobacterium sp. SL14]
MYGSQYLTEENNTLHIDGVAATDLATQYGTPLYVMAERELTDRLATVRNTSLISIRIRMLPSPQKH